MRCRSLGAAGAVLGALFWVVGSGSAPAQSLADLKCEFNNFTARKEAQDTLDKLPRSPMASGPKTSYQNQLKSILGAMDGFAEGKHPSCNELAALKREIMPLERRIDAWNVKREQYLADERNFNSQCANRPLNESEYASCAAWRGRVTNWANQLNQEKTGIEADKAALERRFAAWGRAWLDATGRVDNTAKRLVEGARKAEGDSVLQQIRAVVASLDEGETRGAVLGFPEMQRRLSPITPPKGPAK